jgi:phospholipase/lecithinase/hemolysin
MVNLVFYVKISPIMPETLTPAIQQAFLEEYRSLNLERANTIKLADWIIEKRLRLLELENILQIENLNAAQEQQFEQPLTEDEIATLLRISRAGVISQP